MLNSLKWISIGIGSFGLVLFVMISSYGQQTPEICIREAIRQANRTQAIALPEAVRLTKRIASAVDFKETISVYSCHYVDNAVAYFGDGDRVPKGNYLVYSPKWVQETMGDDGWQIVALFGHEIAHLRNRDHTRMLTMKWAEMETQADEFAGCTVARLGGDLESAIKLFTRIRSAKPDGDYPDRKSSIAAVEAGFERCRQRGAVPEEGIDLGDKLAFENATAIDTVDSYRRYIEAYPGGEFIETALRRMKPSCDKASKNYMVFFDSQRRRVTDAGVKSIEQAAREHAPNGTIFINGHVDAVGPKEFRSRLSVQRANSVKDSLEDEGVPRRSIVSVGWGSSKPLVPTGEGVREPQNTRVEILNCR